MKRKHKIKVTMLTPANKVFESGAVRSTDGEDTRFDLISPIGLRRLAATYAEGSLKYTDFNWEKGIPASNLFNHLIAHINKYLSGDRSEDHLAHAAWGLFAVMHFEELKPEMLKPLRRGIEELT